MTEHHLRDERAGWFALAMNAAASLEDAANCLRDPEAKASALGSAKHVREKCNAMWSALAASAPRCEAPAGWKLVPIEPTREMWDAVNKLDDEMAAGGYDGKGCTIEQAWNCLVESAPPAPFGAAQETPHA